MMKLFSKRVAALLLGCGLAVGAAEVRSNLARAEGPGARRERAIEKHDEEREHRVEKELHPEAYAAMKDLKAAREHMEKSRRDRDGWSDQTLAKIDSAMAACQKYLDQR